MRKMLIVFVMSLMLLIVAKTSAQDITPVPNKFPPYVTQLSGMPAWPKPGDCGFFTILEAIDGQMIPHETTACMRGYVTWLKDQPTAYYLELGGSIYNVIILNKETVDAYFQSH